MKRTVTGFTLIELMVVLAIMAIIMTIAIPSYNDYMRRARRTEAMAQLQNIALMQAKWRSERPAYTADWANLGGDPDTVLATTIGRHYDFDVETNVNTCPDATRNFRLIATGVDDQASDKAQGVSCSPLTLCSDGTTKGPDIRCWK